MKPIILSAAADSDIRAAIGFYLSEDASISGKFIDELERAARHIELHPTSGSPRYAHELDVPQLRHWPLKKFPYLLFYIERSDDLHVVRLVHATRDIPDTLRQES